MDTQRFLQHAIEIARGNLPYSHDGDALQQASEAARAAIDVFEANMGPWIAKPMIVQMGGRSTLMEKIITALMTPSHTMPTRADIEAQIAFEREHGARAE